MQWYKCPETGKPMRKRTTIGFLIACAALSALLLRRAVAAEAGLSTWQKIEGDYRQGLITAADRSLYLLYAVFEYRSLPTAYRSAVPWSGTQVVRELEQSYSRMRTGRQRVTAAVRADFDRLLGPSATRSLCSASDGTATYDSPHFRLGYIPIDAGLTIQQYADALETAWQVEVTDYGWGQPPLAAGNTFGRYPVQAASLGGGLYGFVSDIGGSFTGLVGDNPHTPAVETEATASCMVLNSSYAGFPLDPLSSLRVTVAHEFAHAVQDGLGDPVGGDEDDMIYESMAVYAEDEVFDDINDNYQYLPPAYASCLGQYAASDYSNWLFFRFAAEANGGANRAGGGEDVIQYFWQNVAAGVGALTAMDNGLAAKGSSLAETYHRYAIASRFMRACPDSSPYCFEEAAGYVGAAGLPSSHGNIPAAGGSYSGSIRNHYALNWISLPPSGSYDVSLANNAGSGQLRASVVAQTSGDLTITPFPGLVGPSVTRTVTAYRPPAGALLVVAVITNQEQTSANPSGCPAAGYTLSTGGAGYQLWLPVVFR